MIVIKIAIIISILFICGCGGLKVMRDCSKAEERPEYICKSLGFWE